MTTLEITLSDDVARKAAAAGLLSQEQLEDMLRSRLGLSDDTQELTPEAVAEEIRIMRAERRRAVDRLWDNMRRMQSVPDDNPMSPEDVAEEIRAMRAERRKSAGH